MTTATNVSAPIIEQDSSLKMIRTLGGISLISGILLALAYHGTFDRIERNKEEAMRKAVLQVLPGAEKQVAFEVKDTGELVPLESKEAKITKVFAGYDAAGALVGVAIEGSAQGYADKVRVLYGYSPEKKTTIAFKCLENKETPGLGDKIAKDKDFLANFDGLELHLGDAQRSVKAVKHGNKKNPWEIDAVSGATISGKAVAKAIRESSEKICAIIDKNLDTLKKGV